MKLYNLKHKSEEVTFQEAVLRGLGSDGGLYYPASLPYFTKIDPLLSLDFVSRSSVIMQEMLAGELALALIDKVVKEAFNFPIYVRQITDNIYALELFWGPSLAFKDFGARFMAKIMSAITKESMTVVTATSGDTGAAIAHAFKDLPNIHVVILYPHQGISELQEKLFCTVGGNIHTFAVKGDFDACQALVKQCFYDQSLSFQINSGNSLNISRILPQSLYYFEAFAKQANSKEMVISVPCGNFGNLTGGLFARMMGLPIKSFVASTNANDTVPRYLKTRLWEPNQTIATLSNAMDVSRPNNWPRVMEVFSKQRWPIKEIIRSISVSDAQTKQALLELKNLGYFADPHSAVAYFGLKSCLKAKEEGVFLCTAHPAKFYEKVQEILGTNILPTVLQEVIDKKVLSEVIPNNYAVLKRALLEINEKV